MTISYMQIHSTTLQGIMSTRQRPPADPRYTLPGLLAQAKSRYQAALVAGDQKQAAQHRAIFDELKRLLGR